MDGSVYTHVYIPTVQLKALNALIVPLLSPHIQHELAQYKEPKVAKHQLTIH